MLSTPQLARKQSRTFANGVCYHARMDEKDISRAAKLMVEQYGAEADSQVFGRRSNQGLRNGEYFDSAR